MRCSWRNKAGVLSVSARPNACKRTTNLVVFPLQLLEIVLQYLIALFILLQSVVEPGAEFLKLITHGMSANHDRGLTINESNVRSSVFPSSSLGVGGLRLGWRPCLGLERLSVIAYHLFVECCCRETVPRRPLCLVRLLRRTSSSRHQTAPERQARQARILR